MLINFMVTLIGLQIILGSLDTVLHHEFREKLAWRPSAKNELYLHAVRNLIYGGLFLALAWVMPKGDYAYIFMVFIILEVLITLWDFVEEDLSRKLPATERILHTLLTLNYGAILLLILPYLWVLTHSNTRMEWTNHGWISDFLTFAALAVFLFGIRDWLAAKRLNLMQATPAAPLASVIKPHQHFLITGGTGFLGQRTANALIEAGHDVTVLTRSPEKAAKCLRTPVKIISSFNEIRDEAAIDAVITLAGEPIGNGLWTKAKKARILNSRADMAEALEKLCERLYVPPKTMITASAIGWYGERGNKLLTEESSANHSFTHQVCANLEAAADRFARFGCRVVKLRLGLVLGLEGGVLSNLLVPFEYGLGGPMGNGNHWMSWIERDDAVRLICHALQTREIEGVLNAVAPHPVQGRAFAKALGAALGRPAIIPVSSTLLKMLLGDFAKELLLASQRVVPKKALSTGFVFQSQDLETALAKILPFEEKGKESEPAPHKHMICRSEKR